MTELQKAQTQTILRALQGAGHKMTAARRAVVIALVTGDAHQSHAQVLERARANYPQIGRATVYRTLELLSAMGLVHTTYLGDANQRFVLPADGHHHHVVCVRCGTLQEMDVCYLEEVLLRISQETGFVIQSHSLECVGLCPTCARRRPEAL